MARSSFPGKNRMLLVASGKRLATSLKAVAACSYPMPDTPNGAHAPPAPKLRALRMVALAMLIPLASCSTLRGSGEANAGGPQACPDLSGVFSNVASYADLGDGGSRFLSWHLRVPLPLNDPFADRIRIHPWKDGKLLVEAFSSGKLIAQRELDQAEGHVSCEAGAMLFPAEVSTQSDVLGGARTTKVRLVRKDDTDGAITSQERTTATALAMWVIPFGGRQSYWFRWLPRS